MKSQKLLLGLYSIILCLSFLSLLPVSVEASPSVEEVFATDFESGVVGEHAPSATDFTGASAVLKDEISNTTSVSGSQSLMFNDTHAGAGGASSKWVFPWLDYGSGNLTFFCFINNTSNELQVRLYNETYGASSCLLMFLPDDNGNFRVYTGAYATVQAWANQTWYNITITFAPTNFDVYVNGTLRINDRAYWNTVTWNTLDMITNTTPMDIVYVDDISLYGEYADYDFTWETTYRHNFLNQYYWVGVRKNTTVTPEPVGLIVGYSCRNQWGSFTPELQSTGAYHGTVFHEVKNGSGTFGMPYNIDNDVYVTVTETNSSFYRVDAHGQNIYLYCNNTYWFDKTSPKIYITFSRTFITDFEDSFERQADYLFDKNYISDGFYLNASGYDGHIDNSETVTHEFTGTADSFPLYGFYINAIGRNVSIGGAFTFSYENDARTSGVMISHHVASYAEWELSFGEQYSGALPRQYIPSGTVEKGAGFMYFSYGNENDTQALRTAAQSEFANPTSLIGYDVGSENLRVFGTATLQDVSYGYDNLILTVNSTAGINSTTKIYCSSKGQPISVTGATAYSYDVTTQLLTLNVTHASAQAIVVLWNSAPTIGEFSTPSTVYADDWFNLTIRINDGNGVLEFANASIELTGSIVLQWDNVTNAFSLVQDPDDFCDFQHFGSERSTINSTSYELTWKIRLNEDYPEGDKDVVANNTLVYDGYGASGSNSQLALFAFALLPSTVSVEYQYIVLIIVSLLFTVLSIVYDQKTVLSIIAAVAWYITAFGHIAVGDKTSVLTANLPLVFMIFGLFFTVKVIIQATHLLHEKGSTRAWR